MSHRISVRFAQTSGQACPVPPATPIALSSPRRTLEGILRAAAVSDTDWGSTVAMNLPALATTPREMAAAMDRVAGYAASDLIDWTDDPVIRAMVRTWPAHVESWRASTLGLHAETSFDDIARVPRRPQRPGELDKTGNPPSV